MAKKTPAPRRRPVSLSKDRIVEAAIALLDDSGECGLTFRALAERLSTGAGAIYWHVANKGELLTAACDAVVARAIPESPADAAPETGIRNLALSLFDTIDAHPWVGSALTLAAGQLPMVRILESLGRYLRLLRVPGEHQWATVGALLNYIIGVGGRNAANGQLARAQGLERAAFLDTVATAWSQLDAEAFSFTRGIAAHVRTHDDRADFLAGIDLILAGIKRPRLSQTASTGLNRGTKSKIT